MVYIRNDSKIIKRFPVKRGELDCSIVPIFWSSTVKNGGGIAETIQSLQEVRKIAGLRSLYSL